MHSLSFNSSPFNDRWHVLVPGDQTVTLDLCTHYVIDLCQQAIAERGRFTIALAGGSTPQSLYAHLCSSPYREQIEWGKVWLFWGDERSVPPTSPESNYKMALDAGLAKMEIPQSQIFRMEAEKNIEQNALKYETTLKNILGNTPLDLVLLGLGEDGHTASLFPGTQALQATGRSVVANFVPQKNTWRMTFTFEAINAARHTVIYVTGAAKKNILSHLFAPAKTPTTYPIQQVGTHEHPALWILDEAAASDSFKR